MDLAAPALRAAVERATAESRALRHGYVGTEHLLLALAGARGTLAAHHLERAGVSDDAVRAALVRIVGQGDEVYPPGSELPYTPNSIAVVRRVEREAAAEGPNAIGTEHILRALLQQEDSLAFRTLEYVGIAVFPLSGRLRRPQRDP